jgi:hypothetical protein
MFLKLTRRVSQRLFATCAAALTIIAPASGTWSIVVMDIHSGEIIVAGATCIPNFYLTKPLTCIAVGKGGGASQAFLYQPAKGIMFNGFQAGKSPTQILADINAVDNNFQSRQFGIVGVVGAPVTFTGTNTGAAALGVVGQVGSVRYAIQGNVLAQQSVVFAAEQAFLNGEGDLTQRVMLAMEAATANGGDGRCSCDGGIAPCGQPAEFRRASFTSFLVASRLGDIDSTTCGVTNNNCSSGDYYGSLSEVGNQTTPDPVGVLRRKFDFWHASHQGRPDHYNSEVLQSAQLLKVGSTDSSDFDISLVDINGRPLISGGQTVLVSVVNGPALTISAVTDNGNGTHHFSVSGATTLGVSQLRIVVGDGVRDVQLFPDVEVEVAPAAELFADQHSFSVTDGALMRFEIDSPNAPGATYQLLGSASGTQPGIPFGNLHLPLNRDRFLGLTVNQPNVSVLPFSAGVLSASGQGAAFFAPSPGLLDGQAGGQLDFYVLQLGGAGGVERLTNLITVDLLP